MERQWRRRLRKPGDVQVVILQEGARLVAGGSGKPDGLSDGFFVGSPGPVGPQAHPIPQRPTPSYSRRSSRLSLRMRWPYQWMTTIYLLSESTGHVSTPQPLALNLPPNLATGAFPATTSGTQSQANFCMASWSAFSRAVERQRF